jgi:hypothetical protein
VDDMLKPRHQRRARAAAAGGQHRAVEAVPAGRRRGTSGASASSSRTRSSRTPACAAQGSGNWAGIFNTFFWIDPEGRTGRGRDDADAAVLRRRGDRRRCRVWSAASTKTFK